MRSATHETPAPSPHCVFAGPLRSQWPVDASPTALAPKFGHRKWGEGVRSAQGSRAARYPHRTHSSVTPGRMLQTGGGSDAPASGTNGTPKPESRPLRGVQSTLADQRPGVWRDGTRPVSCTDGGPVIQSAHRLTAVRPRYTHTHRIINGLGRTDLPLFLCRPPATHAKQHVSAGRSAPALTRQHVQIGGGCHFTPAPRYGRSSSSTQDSVLRTYLNSFSTSLGAKEPARPQFGFSSPFQPPAGSLPRHPMEGYDGVP